MNVEFTVEPEDLTAQVRELEKVIYTSRNGEHPLWPLLEVLHDHLIDCGIPYVQLGLSCSMDGLGRWEDDKIFCPNDCADWPLSKTQWCPCECHA